MFTQTKTPFELYGAEIGQGCYIDTGSDRVFDLIDEYENKSFSICEICGDPGKLMGHGWLMTRCEKHKNE